MFLLVPIPHAKADGHDTDLSPVAVKVFRYCLDAAFEGRQLTDKIVSDEVLQVIEGTDYFGEHHLLIEVRDDFECYLEIPSESFNARKLRDLLVSSKASGFDGRVKHCRWVLGVDGGRASLLQCSLSSNSDPANSFRVRAGIVPYKGAIFWVEPLLIFDGDGRLRLSE